MLAKVNRFHGHNSVRAVYRRGKQVKNILGSLHFVSDPKRTQSQVAVVASRKLAKSAVVRNRIRRRVYESLRPKLSDFNTPAQLVFTIYQAEAADWPSQKIVAATEELLRKAKII